MADAWDCYLAIDAAGNTGCEHACLSPISWILTSAAIFLVGSVVFKGMLRQLRLSLILFCH
jgi:uncharacterized membrane protein YgdD (TMEM256/DUF423 family)